MPDSQEDFDFLLEILTTKFEAGKTAPAFVPFMKQLVVATAGMLPEFEVKQMMTHLNETHKEMLKAQRLKDGKKEKKAPTKAALGKNKVMSKKNRSRSGMDDDIRYDKYDDCATILYSFFYWSRPFIDPLTFSPLILASHSTDADKYY
eukprot:SAG31_NODE_1783_length_7280_cov_105.645314_2_plen_148_part_00